MHKHEKKVGASGEGGFRPDHKKHPITVLKRKWGANNDNFVHKRYRTLKTFKT